MTIDLATLIKTAPSVPTVVIPTGDYPVIPLHDVNPSNPVRVVAQGKVTLAGLQLVRSSNLVFEGFTIQQPPTTDDNVKTVFFQNCSHITLIEVPILGVQTGIPHAHAVVMTDSHYLTLTKCEIAYFFKGVSFDSTDDSTVSGCDIHHVRTSAVNGYGQRVTLMDSYIHDMLFAVPTDHHDGAHFFTVGQKLPMNGLTIARNRFEAAFATGSEGINLQGTADSWFTNVSVIDNDMPWNCNQGISLDYVQSGQFRRNALYPHPGLQDPKQAPTFITQNRRLGPPNGLVIADNSCKKIASFNPAYGGNHYLTDAEIAKMGAAV